MHRIVQDAIDAEVLVMRGNVLKGQTLHLQVALGFKPAEIESLTARTGLSGKRISNQNVEALESLFDRAVENCEAEGATVTKSVVARMFSDQYAIKLPRMTRPLHRRVRAWFEVLADDWKAAMQHPGGDVFPETPSAWRDFGYHREDAKARWPRSESSSSTPKGALASEVPDRARVRLAIKWLLYSRFRGDEKGWPATRRAECVRHLVLLSYTPNDIGAIANTSCDPDFPANARAVRAQTISWLRRLKLPADDVALGLWPTRNRNDTQTGKD